MKNKVKCPPKQALALIRSSHPKNLSNSRSTRSPCLHAWNSSNALYWSLCESVYCKTVIIPCTEERAWHVLGLLLWLHMHSLGMPGMLEWSLSPISGQPSPIMIRWCNNICFDQKKKVSLIWRVSVEWKVKVFFCVQEIAIIHYTRYDMMCIVHARSYAMR